MNTSCFLKTAGRSTTGFSLMELLTVMAVVSVLAAVSLPALSGLKTSGDFSQGTSDISSNLERARAYAMGNNTYVYVGIQEVDGLTPTSPGVGRLVVAAIASQDGTRPYANSPTAITASNAVLISKPQVYGNVHLARIGTLISSGNMVRPSASDDLGGTTTAVTFQWPLSGSAKYNFSKVIEFDPQGVARLQTSNTYSSAIPSYIEIPLIPAHGNLAVGTPVNQAALQIQGITGAVRAYRP